MCLLNTCTYYTTLLLLHYTVTYMLALVGIEGGAGDGRYTDVLGQPPVYIRVYKYTLK